MSYDEIYRDDVNAHDMYIPTMAFITYILLAGLSLGTEGQFKLWVHIYVNILISRSNSNGTYRVGL